jgi:hypothetical protein
MPHGKFRSSEQTDKIDAAVAKAQARIRAAGKNAINPHFKSRFADLASIVDACRAPLAESGVAVIQAASSEGKAITVTTRLACSGQYYESDLTVDAAQAGPQALGSAVSYLKRYGLAAMAGVATGDDDDGESAEGRGDPGPGPDPQRPRQASTPSADALQKPMIPQGVVDLWVRAGEKWPSDKDREREFGAARLRVFGSNPPPKEKWGAKEIAAMEEQLFGANDVKF